VSSDKQTRSGERNSLFRNQEGISGTDMNTRSILPHIDNEY